MKLGRCLAALFLLVIVTACSSDAAHVTPAPLVNIKPTAQFDIRWQHQVINSGLVCLQRDRSFCWKEAMSYKVTNVLIPSVSANSVFAANGNNEIECYDLSTGKRRWKVANAFEISGGVG